MTNHSPRAAALDQHTAAEIADVRDSSTPHCPQPVAETGVISDRDLRAVSAAIRKLLVVILAGCGVLAVVGYAGLAGGCALAAACQFAAAQLTIAAGRALRSLPPGIVLAASGALFRGMATAGVAAWAWATSPALIQNGFLWVLLANYVVFLTVESVAIAHICSITPGPAVAGVPKSRKPFGPPNQEGSTVDNPYGPR